MSESSDEHLSGAVKKIREVRTNTLPLPVRPTIPLVRNVALDTAMCTHQYQRVLRI